MTLSVAIITRNEERNIRRTLESVRPIADEIVIVDDGSTDHTLDIAREFGAILFVEDWKGYAAQKNSALEKCTGDWILALDADEEVDSGLAIQLGFLLGKAGPADIRPDDSSSHGGAPIGTSFAEVAQQWQAYAERYDGFYVRRKNMFLGRWIRHGGFWPDPKLRVFRRGATRFEARAVHEDAIAVPRADVLKGALIHHSYPTLADFIDHMNRYSSLAAGMAVEQRKQGFSLVDIVLRPKLTFLYNYIFRLGFLDGREGLLLHLYHATYVSWKYAKAWESSRKPPSPTG